MSHSSSSAHSIINNNNNEPPPPLHIAGDFPEAATDILTSGFAIIRMDDAKDTEKLTNAWSSARNFFSRIHDESTTITPSSSSLLHRHLVKYRRIVDGNLHGFNCPSPSKLLYRILFLPSSSSSDDESLVQETNNNNNDDINGHIVPSLYHPWPDGDDGAELRTSSMTAAMILHDILLKIFKEIKLLSSSSSKSYTNATTITASTTTRQDSDNAKRRRRREETTTTTSALLKKKKRSQHDDAFENNNERNRIISPFFIDNDNRQQHEIKAMIPTVTIIRSSSTTTTTATTGDDCSIRRWSYCPLDYFFYHNPFPTTNCSAHVDRGVLIAVVLTDVLGLEVKPRGSNSFLCPEVLSRDEGLYGDKRAISGLVCVMAGGQLGLAACGCRCCEGVVVDDSDCDAEGVSNDGCRNGGVYAACVHRVREKLERARLSITYELRM